MNENRRIENLPIYKIIPNIYQPRIKFDDKSIINLANSIKKYGIIQPIIVRKIENSYEIIDGERRYKAAKKIGLKEVPTIILDIDEKETAELILMENMQKQLLTPIEEANAYQQIMLLNKFDINELSNKVGIEKNIIESKLKLLTLLPEIQSALLNNKISEGHAKALTKIHSKQKQYELYNKVINKRLTVKALEEIINKEVKEKAEKEISSNIETQKDVINIKELNKKDFLISQKENKTEEKNMNNSQLNFNQYNNLLKEQEKMELGASNQPEPILGNSVIEPNPNDFFPSLEEQPLNIDIPISEQNDIPTSMQTPQFEVPTPMMETQPVMQEQPMLNPGMVTQQMSEMGIPTGMPQFEVPTPIVETQPVMQEQPMLNPGMVTQQMPEMGIPTGMPQFEVPTPIVETQPIMQEQPMLNPGMVTQQMPEMGIPTGMPQFEVPTPIVETQPIMQEQPMLNPGMVTQQMPEMGIPTGMPQFEVPTPIVETQPIIQEPVITNVMPAVNMVRNIVPLLENSGYKIILEETDNQTEYQIILKVQK